MNYKKSLYAGILILPTLIFLAIGDANHFVRLFPDDAFYYLNTAFNTARMGVVSFDGLNPTNGFHPLQFLIATSMAFVADKEHMLMLSILENAVAVILTSWILTSGLLRKESRELQILAMLILSMPLWYLYIWLDAGMEVGPVLLIGSLFYCIWDKASETDFSSTSLNCKLAFVASLLILARLDLVIALLPFVIVYLYFIFEQKSRWRLIGLSSLSATFLLALYLLWNLTQHGHLVPVSGVVKSGFEHNIIASWRGMTSGNLIGVMITILPAIFIVIAFFTSERNLQRRNLAILFVSLIIYYVYIFMFAKDVFRWYLAYPLAIQSIGMAIVLRNIFRRRSKKLIKVLSEQYSIGLLFISVAMHGLLYFWAAHLNTTSYQLKMIADDINQKVSEESVVAAFDAGVIGFFSHAKVINLDGLANSFDYYENYLRPGKFKEYFDLVGVTHFIVRTPNIKPVADNQNINTFIPDERIILKQDSRIGEYEIPGQFSVALFRL